MLKQGFQKKIMLQSFKKMVGLEDTSRFSNALPFPIKVMVHQNEPRPVSFRKITNHEW